MDQIKISSFLKKLRKEKGLTQEQLAEEFNVSRRTVTRWETGVNMPDLDIIVALADFYDVDLREIFDGERKSERMDKELEKTVKQAAEYSNIEQKKVTKVVMIYVIIGMVSFIANQVLTVFIEMEETFWAGFAKGVTCGLTVLALLFSLLYITGRLTKLSEAKKRMLEK